MTNFHYHFAWTGDLSHKEVCEFIGIDVLPGTDDYAPISRLGRVHVTDENWGNIGFPLGVQKWSGALHFHTKDDAWIEMIVVVMVRVIYRYFIREDSGRNFFIRDELSMLECSQGRTRVSMEMLQLIPKSIIDNWPHHIEVGILSEWIHAPD